jgi:hypothetical protein
MSPFREPRLDTPVDPRSRWPAILIVTGGLAMVIGAIDPLEGSLVILPGSALAALGTYLGGREPRVIAYRVLVFILIAIGVGAMWGLSAVGGMGGSSGRSMWWGVLVLPYPIGWSMGIWGPGSPRWLLRLGIGVGLWYLTILGMVLAGAGHGPAEARTLAAGPVGALGVLTIGGCASRLRKRAGT